MYSKCIKPTGLKANRTYRPIFDVVTDGTFFVIFKIRPFSGTFYLKL